MIVAVLGVLFVTISVPVCAPTADVANDRIRMTLFTCVSSSRSFAALRMTSCGSHTLHGRPKCLDVGALGSLGADRHADHPASVENCRCDVGDPRCIQPLGPHLSVRVERVATQPCL